MDIATGTIAMAATVAIIAAWVAQLIGDLKSGSPLRPLAYLRLLRGAVPMIVILSAALMLLWLVIAGVFLVVGLMSGVSSLLISLLVTAVFACIGSSFCVLPCAIVIERKAFSGLSRSLKLTKGYRLPVFVTIFLATLVTALAYAGIVSLDALVSEFGVSFISSDILSEFLILIIFGLCSTFIFVTVSLIFFRLRAIKDGIEAGTIATVFD